MHGIDDYEYYYDGEFVQMARQPTITILNRPKLRMSTTVSQ